MKKGPVSVLLVILAFASLFFSFILVENCKTVSDVPPIIFFFCLAPELFILSAGLQGLMIAEQGQPIRLEKLTTGGWEKVTK